MNQRIKLFIMMLMMFIFVGCDTIIDSEVKLSELQNNKTNHIYSDLYLEVSACNDYEDSRKLSEEHIKAKKSIPNIFQDSKYIECFSKEMNTYVHFKIPIVLAKSHEVVSNQYIQFSTTKKELLSIVIPATIKRKIAKFEEKAFTSIDLKMKIKLINDTNKNMDFTALSVYLNDEPYLVHTFNMLQDSFVSIRLSDVSIDNALNNGRTRVLVRKIGSRDIVDKASPLKYEDNPIRKNEHNINALKHESNTGGNDSTINNMIVMNRDEVDTDTLEVKIEGNGESCILFYDSTNSIYKNTCKYMKNSKGVKIYCTPRKKMCKTYSEIRNYVLSGY